MAERPKDLCPCRGREIRGVHDYPRVFVANLQRGELPTDLVLPVYVRDLFIDPQKKGETRNRTVPSKVVDIFEQEGSDAVSFHDWKWSRRSWGQEYIYELSNPNGRKFIGHLLERNLDRLQGMVGIEVSRQQLRMRQPRHDGYRFEFIETGSNGDLKVAQIQLVHWGGGTISAAKRLAMVGEMTYQGRFLDRTS